MAVLAYNIDRASSLEAVTRKAIVRARSIFKTYATRTAGDVPALEDINLEVKDSEFVTIVGPSGCGKSTVLKIAGGIIAPSSGELLFEGKPLLRPSPEIGMVFQKAILLPWRSVLDNVLFPIEMLGLSPKEYRHKAIELLNLVGLGGFENVYP